MTRKAPRTAIATKAPIRTKKSAAAKVDPKVIAPKVLRRLKADYPDVTCALGHESAFELLVSTILSAQCTDVRVNMVTPVLFGRWPTPADLARAPIEQIEKVIQSTGFFRNKAKNIKSCAQVLCEKYDGAVPQQIEQLVELPGVGRKTANVVLGNAFHRDEGIVVDTHVTRLSERLGLTAESDPVKIEQDLMRVVPRDEWTMFSHLLIFHGRRVCSARAPAHGRCVLATICPSATLV